MDYRDELVSALFDLLPKTMSVEVEGSKDMEVCHLNYLQNLVLGLLENIAKSTDVKAQVNILFFSYSLAFKSFVGLNSLAGYG